MSALRRKLRDTRLVIRHLWWKATNERARVISERDHLRQHSADLLTRLRAAEHAVYMLKVEHLGSSIDTLRAVADQIDCGSDCEQVSPMDWSTGAHECHLSDRGECPLDDACQLRDLATALETHAALRAKAVGEGV